VDEPDRLVERFEAHRSRLRALAYRMLGDVGEADDAVQETWLRLTRTAPAGIENLGGWLTTVAARICLNILRSRAQRREEPLGVHVPEPIISPAHGMDPEHEALLADSVGLALMVVLETLTPAERLAFVLHDMFAVPFDEIAILIERSPAATRQLASRARRRVQGQAPAPDPDPVHQRAVVDAFFVAARRRFRRASGCARPGRRAAGRRPHRPRTPDRCHPHRSRGRSTSRPSESIGPVRVSCPDQRERWGGHRDRWEGVVDHGVHRCQRQDRRHGCALRPEALGRGGRHRPRPLTKR